LPSTATLSSMLPLAALVFTALPSSLTPGAYAIDVDVVGARDLPLSGDVDVHTTIAAFVVVDAAGNAQETLCAFTSDAPHFVTRATAATIRALPRQRYRLDVVDGRLRADLGNFRVGTNVEGAPIDTDGDGKPGAAFEVDTALGTLTLEIVALWRVSIDGVIDDGGRAHGAVRADIDETALSGLPFGELGRMRVDAARSTFRVRPIRSASCSAR
jgi:hypothetical protein